ncbi:MAG: 6,7-dimethyl-8-ribityllumazine synthase [Nitrospirota bacterium]
MPKVVEGSIIGKGLRFGIVVSRFNDFISDKLLGGAVDALTRSGAKGEDIEIARVPGSFEIPLVAKKMAQTGKYDAIICLGAIIRGATPHFEYLSAEVTKGIAQISLDLIFPIAYGIITSDNLEQAIERAGTKSGNKGWDAALSAIEMVNLFKNLK